MGRTLVGRDRGIGGSSLLTPFLDPLLVPGSVRTGTIPSDCGTDYRWVTDEQWASREVSGPSLLALTCGLSLITYRHWYLLLKWNPRGFHFSSDLRQVDDVLDSGGAFPPHVSRISVGDSGHSWVGPLTLAVDDLLDRLLHLGNEDHGHELFPRGQFSHPIPRSAHDLLVELLDAEAFPDYLVVVVEVTLDGPGEGRDLVVGETASAFVPRIVELPVLPVEQAGEDHFPTFELVGIFDHLVQGQEAHPCSQEDHPGASTDDSTELFGCPLCHVGRIGTGEVACADDGELIRHFELQSGENTPTKGASALLDFGGGGGEGRQPLTHPASISFV